jgi:hypothetical protein
MPRVIKYGVSFGIVAGIIFVIAEMLSAGVTGELGLMPLRMFASVVIGGAAMTTNEIVPTAFLGLLVHFVLSAIFGALYALLHARMPVDVRESYLKQAVLGMMFGLVLWLVNFQVIARILYPWFLAPPQGLQLALHALAYGLPLALLFAVYERSAHRVPPAMPRPV